MTAKGTNIRRAEQSQQRSAIIAEIVKLEQRFSVRAVVSAFNRHTMVRRKRAQLKRAEAQIQDEIRRLES